MLLAALFLRFWFVFFYDVDTNALERIVGRVLSNFFQFFVLNALPLCSCWPKAGRMVMMALLSHVFRTPLLFLPVTQSLGIILLHSPPPPPPPPQYLYYPCTQVPPFLTSKFFFQVSLPNISEFFSPSSPTDPLCPPTGSGTTFLSKSLR